MDDEVRTSAQQLVQILREFGITEAGDPALSDRESLGHYLVKQQPPGGLTAKIALEQWREHRRLLSLAGVERLREALTRAEEAPRMAPSPVARPREPTPAPESKVAAPTPVAEPVPAPAEPPREAAPSTGISAEEMLRGEVTLAQIREGAPSQFGDTILRMEDLTGQNRFPEAFRAGIEAFERVCEEALLDACLFVSHQASRWDRQARIAPYSLCEPFEELAAAFGKHVREMRHFDPDPLRATSGMYRLATKVYFGWVDHCAAILEHQHRRTNTAWIQVEWIQPHRFNALLAIMRSSVRIKLPLDLLARVYQRIRKVIEIGKEAIALDTRKIKFEGDCLRVLASPTKDVIPDLCYQIYRDIIDTYVRAGESAAAMMFCDQALLIRRGDHEVEQIKADIIAKSGRQNTLIARPGTTGPRPFRP